MPQKPTNTTYPRAVIDYTAKNTAVQHKSERYLPQI